MAEVKPGTGGDHYIPYEERKGNESIVYFTRDLSAEGLKKIYEKISANLTGKIAVKLHTGEKHGPNILPRPWVKELLEKEIPDATIIETNTYYEGDRYTTAQHRETLKVNGWTFAPVDIIDDESHGTTMLPVKGGKWFDAMSFWTMIPSWLSPISRAIPRAVSADPTRISASAAQTAASAKP